MSALSQGNTGYRTMWSSTIGLKIAMAASGILLAGFVLFHMLGNLQIFAGQEQFNNYAEFMQGLGALLWMARLGLLALLALHVWTAIALIQRNAAARPSRYEGQKRQATTLNAQIMKYSGFVILGFIIIHILHFTVGVIYPDLAALVDDQGRRDVYNYFVLSFARPEMAILYVAANVFVASHLSHAMTSIFRTLGLMEGKYRKTFTYVGPVFATIVALGNIAMPLAALVGILEPTTQLGG